MATTDKVLLCKYVPYTLIFAKDDETLTMDPSNILSIEKVDDYEYNLRSILKISLRMDIRKKLWLLKNKRSIMCKFELDIIGQNSEADSYVTNNESVINGEFSIYFNDQDESIDTVAMEQGISGNGNSNEESTSNISTESYFDSENIIDVYLMNSKLLNASMKMCNRIYSSGTLQQFVGEILTSSKHKNVLMSRFENFNQYKEMIVPSLPAYKALIYLDQYYGFYKTGALIYYDIDKLYILNTNGKSSTICKKEYPETTFMIRETSNCTPGNGMVRKQQESVYYINIPETNFSPQQTSIAKNAELGSEAKIVVTDDTTIDIEDADQTYMDQRNQYIKYIKKDDNQFTASILKARMEENDCIAYLTGDNFDMRAFTPNKIFQLIFDDTAKQNKYGKHKYRLVYAYHYIKLQSQSTMTSTHRIILKRVCN